MTIKKSTTGNIFIICYKYFVLLLYIYIKEKFCQLCYNNLTFEGDFIKPLDILKAAFWVFVSVSAPESLKQYKRISG